MTTAPSGLREGAPSDSARQAEFGRGGAQPYDLALRSGGGHLAVVRAATAGDAVPTVLDVSAYLQPATADERHVLALTSGPVLDVGCGPARMVRAAIEAGRLALGIDISYAAVQHARALGLPVLHRSVFDPVPAEGTWGTVALFDGNIGIGGDPVALLARASALLRAGGRLIVEAHPEPSREHRFTAQLAHPVGGRSDWFPWAEFGEHAVRRVLGESGMDHSTVTAGGRTFVLARR